MVHASFQIYLNAGEWKNAMYVRKSQSLYFFHFSENGGQMLYTCESYDIVAHETGHAVLDIIRPQYLLSKLLQTRARHECFADMMVILSLLDQFDMCQTILELTRGDLHSPIFFQKIAEFLGEENGLAIGIRSVNNNARMNEVPDRLHPMSTVFSGALYDILVELFERIRDPETASPAEYLSMVGKHMMDLLFAAFVSAPEEDVTFVDIAKLLINVEPIAAYKEIIEKHFNRRKIFDASKSAGKLHSASTYDATLCGTCLESNTQDIMITAPIAT